MFYKSPPLFLPHPSTYHCLHCCWLRYVGNARYCQSQPYILHMLGWVRLWSWMSLLTPHTPTLVHPTSPPLLLPHTSTYHCLHCCWLYVGNARYCQSQPYTLHMIGWVRLWNWMSILTPPTPYPTPPHIPNSSPSPHINLPLSPLLLAKIRGKRQILPVPTIHPTHDRMSPILELNVPPECSSWKEKQRNKTK